MPRVYDTHAPINLLPLYFCTLVLPVHCAVPSPRRPRSVHLGPHTYAIKWRKERWTADPADDTERQTGEFRVGETHLLDNTIAVALDSAPTQVAATLIHEILHAALHQTHVRHMAGWDDDVEEAIVTALEPKLLELFTRNPAAVAWLASPSV